MPQNDVLMGKNEISSLSRETYRGGEEKNYHEDSQGFRPIRSMSAEINDFGVKKGRLRAKN